MWVIVYWPCLSADGNGEVEQGRRGKFGACYCHVCAIRRAVTGSQMLIENSGITWPLFGGKLKQIHIIRFFFFTPQYECKVQNLKKRKVTIHISVNGVRVVLKKRRRKVSQCLTTYICLV